MTSIKIEATDTPHIEKAAELIKSTGNPTIPEIM